MQTCRGGWGRTEHRWGPQSSRISFLKKNFRSPKRNVVRLVPMIAIMARRPHIRKCWIRLPGCKLFVNFFVFSGGSLDSAALRFLGEDLVAEVILKGWCLGAGLACCNFFVFSSGSLVLGPELRSFVECEDRGAEVTLCKPTGFGRVGCFANFFVFSSGSLALALRAAAAAATAAAAARAKVAINLARLSPPLNPPPPPTPPHRSNRGLFKLCTSIYQTLLTSQVCRGGGVGGGGWVSRGGVLHWRAIWALQ